MLKPNLGCSGMVMGKLNQWKICIFHYALLNVISIKTSSYLNVGTKPMMNCHRDRETEPTESFHLANEISMSKIMKKILKMVTILYRKHSNYNPPQSFQFVLHPIISICSSDSFILAHFPFGIIFLLFSSN